MVSVVVVCSAMGGPPGAWAGCVAVALPGVWAVGRPTLHGGLVRLRPVRATPCIIDVVVLMCFLMLFLWTLSCAVRTGLICYLAGKASKPGLVNVYFVLSAIRLTDGRLVLLSGLFSAMLTDWQRRTCLQWFFYQMEQETLLKLYAMLVRPWDKEQFWLDTVHDLGLG